MSISTTVFVFLLVFCLTQAQTADLFERAPRIVVHKTSSSSLEGAVVVNKEFAITYFLVNIGDAKAIDVMISDLYDTQLFEGVENIETSSGTVKFVLPVLEVRKTMNFTVTLIPKAEGSYTISRAHIKYYNGAVVLEDDEEYDEEDMLLGYSSSIPQLNVLSSEEYILSTSSHIFAWVSFALASCISVALPAMAWRRGRIANSEILLNSK